MSDYTLTDSERGLVRHTDEPRGYMYVEDVARLIATHREQAARDALNEAADDIRSRISIFKNLAADSQYMNALHDAWGLVKNRARAAVTQEATR